MLDKAIITAASNKFFPSLINLLGSIKVNYPNHPKIYIYDLGLLWIFKKELKQIENVELLKVPHFVSFWRSCYTWKTYILSHPLARLNFYLDAGCEVLSPLDGIFNQIDKDDYFIIGQGVTLGQIVPQDYWNKLDLDSKYANRESIHAGELGFKAGSDFLKILEQVYNWAKEGLALGFSVKDQWRNKGHDKNDIVRNCEIFRHDMTLLNIGVRKKMGDSFIIHPVDIYAGGKNMHLSQVIWNLRLSYKKLDYTKISILHKKNLIWVFLNRLIIYCLITLKNVNIYIKSKLELLN